MNGRGGREAGAAAPNYWPCMNCVIFCRVSRKQLVLLVRLLQCFNTPRLAYLVTAATLSCGSTNILAAPWDHCYHLQIRSVGSHAVQKKGDIGIFWELLSSRAVTNWVKPQGLIIRILENKILLIVTYLAHWLCQLITVSITVACL